LKANISDVIIINQMLEENMNNKVHDAHVDGNTINKDGNPIQELQIPLNRLEMLQLEQHLQLKHKMQDKAKKVLMQTA